MIKIYYIWLNYNLVKLTNPVNNKKPFMKCFGLKQLKILIKNLLKKLRSIENSLTLISKNILFSCIKSKGRK